MVGSTRKVVHGKVVNIAYDDPGKCRFPFVKYVVSMITRHYQAYKLYLFSIDLFIATGLGFSSLHVC